MWRLQVGLAVVNERLFAVGGFDGTNYLKSVEVSTVATREITVVSISPLIIVAPCRCTIARRDSGERRSRWPTADSEEAWEWSSTVDIDWLRGFWNIDSLQETIFGFDLAAAPGRTNGVWRAIRAIVLHTHIICYGQCSLFCSFNCLSSMLWAIFCDVRICKYVPNCPSWATSSVERSMIGLFFAVIK